MKEHTWQEYCNRVRRLEKRVTVLEQKPILDKIRVEIENIDTNYYRSVNGIDMTECADDFKDWILEILDKYKVESEE